MLSELLLLAAVAAPMPAGTAHTVKSQDGVAIHYDVYGAGEPTLLFIHGFALDGSLWDAQVKEIAQFERVVTIDLAGHGKSGRDRKDWSIEAFGADVKAVVDDLGADQVLLVGHSMGGPVALEAGRRMKDSLVGIVLVDTLLDVTQKTPEAERDAFTKELRADYQKTMAAMAENYLFAPKTPPAVKERVLRAAAALDREAAIAMLRAAWSYDPLPVLREIEAPIRAVNADKFPTNLEENRKAMPGFEVSLVKGSGHYPMLEDPKRFSAAFSEAADRVVNAQVLPGAALTGEGSSVRRYAVHGSGPVTVVFEAGFGNGMGTWKPVFQRISQFARVFAYDRPGYGGSATGPMPRTPEQVVGDLRALLKSAGVAPPYVLVGHSLGGIYVEWFARHHPEEVAGLVLEDARSSFVTGRCLARKLQHCQPGAKELAEMNATMRSEITQMNKFPNVSVPKGLEKLPVTVLTGARRRGETADDRGWADLWWEAQRGLASESVHRRQLVFSDSGHYVHADQSDAFVAALRDIVARSSQRPSAGPAR